jgi:hypothetical protein
VETGCTHLINSRPWRFSKLSFKTGSTSQAQLLIIGAVINIRHIRYIHRSLLFCLLIDLPLPLWEHDSKLWSIDVYSLSPPCSALQRCLVLVMTLLSPSLFLSHVLVIYRHTAFGVFGFRASPFPTLCIAGVLSLSFPSLFYFPHS